MRHQYVDYVENVPVMMKRYLTRAICAMNYLLSCVCVD